MNKKQLDSLIWDCCNGLRGPMSTVETQRCCFGFHFL